MWSGESDLSSSVDSCSPVSASRGSEKRPLHIEQSTSLTFSEVSSLECTPRPCQFDDRPVDPPPRNAQLASDLSDERAAPQDPSRSSIGAPENPRVSGKLPPLRKGPWVTPAPAPIPRAPTNHSATYGGPGLVPSPSGVVSTQEAPPARPGVVRPPPEIPRSYTLKKSISPAGILPSEELRGKNGDRFKLKYKLEKPDKHFLMEMMNRGEMFVVSDAGKKDNRIEFASPAFLAYTRYTRDELLGQDLRFLQGDETEPEDAGDIRDAIDKKYDSHFGICNYRADGTPFFNQFFLTPLRKYSPLTRTGHGPIVYFLAVQIATTQSSPVITRENVRKFSSLFRYRQSAELGTNLTSDSMLEGVIEEMSTGAPVPRPNGLERAIVSQHYMSSKIVYSDDPRYTGKFCL